MAVERLSRVEPAAARQAVVLATAVVLRVHVAPEAVLRLEAHHADLALVAHELVVGAEVEVVRLLRRERLAAGDAPVVAAVGVRGEGVRVWEDLVADETAHLAAGRVDDLTVPARQVHLEAQLRVEGQRAEEARVLEDGRRRRPVVAGAAVRRRLPHAAHVARVSPQRLRRPGAVSSGRRLGLGRVRRLHVARLLLNIRPHQRHVGRKFRQRSASGVRVAGETAQHAVDFRRGDELLLRLLL